MFEMNRVGPVLFACFGLAISACAKVETAETYDLARLTMLDVATAIQLANTSSTCGFESLDAVRTQEVVGEKGTEGTVTRTIEKCVVDLTLEPSRYPYFTCDAMAGTAHGKITFSGSRTITGRITGDERSPVIPSSDYALTIDVTEIEFSNFAVSRLDKAGSAEIQSGKVSGKAAIRLAASKTDGLCRVPTPNAQFQSINFQNAKVAFNSVVRKDFTITSSDLQATSGFYNNTENELKGVMTIDGQKVDVPGFGKQASFDDAYSSVPFAESFACADGKARLPVTYNCSDIDGFVAENSARISFLTLTNIIATVAEDTTCGFKSPQVLAAQTFEGELGEYGALVQRVDNCTITNTKPLNLPEDCNKESNAIGGTFTISAKRILSGVLTPDPDVPVLTSSDRPLRYEVSSVNLRDFKIEQPRRSVVITSGQISGNMTPRVAKNNETRFCSVPTKISEFTNVNLQNADIQVTTEIGVVSGHTEQSDLDGTNGKWGDKENILSGTITTNGRDFVLPTTMDSGLFDNEYIRERFDATWTCEPTLVQPIDYSCGEEKFPAGETVAQFTISMLGAIADQIEVNTSCGFASPGVIASAQATAGVGNVGSTTFTLPGCRLEFPEETVIRTDCNGRTTSLKGVATVRGTKVMTGYNTGSSSYDVDGLSQLVIPTNRDGIVFNLQIETDDITLTEHVPGYVPESLTAYRGTLVGKVTPRLGLSKTTNVCSKRTPVTTFENAGFTTDTGVKLVVKGRVSDPDRPTIAYQTRVSDMSLFAQNGLKGEIENRIDGRITVQGETLTFPINGVSTLDPMYSREYFDMGYQSCDTNLVVPTSDEACNYKQEIALHTARYLPSIVQSMATLVNNNRQCGLAIEDERIEPYDTDDLPNDMGISRWRAPQDTDDATCNYNRTAAQALVSTDCSNRTLNLSGTWGVYSTLTMTGEQESEGDVDYVNPVAPDGGSIYTIDLQNFSNLEMTMLDPGAVPIQRLMIPSGSITAQFNPIMGHSTDENFTYTIRTPVNRFTNITYAGNTPILLRVRDMTFNVTLGGASVKGFSGTHNALTTGGSNSIEGQVTIDGRSYTIPKSPLDPDYVQADFDARYVCYAKLREVVPTTFP